MAAVISYLFQYKMQNFLIEHTTKTTAKFISKK